MRVTLSLFAALTPVACRCRSLSAPDPLTSDRSIQSQLIRCFAPAADGADRRSMDDQPQMSQIWLTVILYRFAAGAMAVNLFFASLIASWIGWPVLTPAQSVMGGAVPGLPATLVLPAISIN